MRIGTTDAKAVNANSWMPVLWPRNWLERDLEHGFLEWYYIG